MYQAEYTKETRTACVYCPLWRDRYTTVIPALESNDSDKWVFCYSIYLMVLCQLYRLLSKGLAISFYKLGLLLIYHIHKLLSYVFYCQVSFCTMPVVIQ